MATMLKASMLKGWNKIAGKSGKQAVIPSAGSAASLQHTSRTDTTGVTTEGGSTDSGSDSDDGSGTVATPPATLTTSTGQPVYVRSLCACAPPFVLTQLPWH